MNTASITELEPASSTWPEVRIQSMDRPRSSLTAALRRMENRATQVVIDNIMRRGLAMRARDPAALDSFITRWRNVHARLDRPAKSVMIQAEAIRRGGPGLAAPPPPLPSEWFAPKLGEPHGHVFYVHGGSFIAERSPKITAMVARFAAAAGAQVYAPNYRLAPEHPCPAAVYDIVAAFEWFRRVWPDEPVVAMAESAGAAILLAALQVLRDRGEAMPEGVLLLSPWVDLSLQSWSVVAASLAASTPYTMSSLALMTQLYLQGRNPTDPIASPLFGDFQGFPPMMIHASKDDILYDDAVRLADRVRDANGDLTLRLWSSETHVWERSAGPTANDSIERGAEFIRRRLR